MVGQGQGDTDPPTARYQFTTSGMAVIRVSVGEDVGSEDTCFTGANVKWHSLFADWLDSFLKS